MPAKCKFLIMFNRILVSDATKQMTHEGLVRHANIHMSQSWNVNLDVELQISAGHVTRDDGFNQLDGNQLITVVARTRDVVCVAVQDLATQISTSTIHRLYVTYSVSRKNDTDVAHYNFNAHQLIVAIFGSDVAERVCYQMVICYPTSPN